MYFFFFFTNKLFNNVYYLLIRGAFVILYLSLRIVHFKRTTSEICYMAVQTRYELIITCHYMKIELSRFPYTRKCITVVREHCILFDTAILQGALFLFCILIIISYFPNSMTCNFTQDDNYTVLLWYVI